MSLLHLTKNKIAYVTYAFHTAVIIHFQTPEGFQRPTFSLLGLLKSVSMRLQPLNQANSCTRETI